MTPEQAPQVPPLPFPYPSHDLVKNLVMGGDRCFPQAGIEFADWAILKSVLSKATAQAVDEVICHVRGQCLALPSSLPLCPG